MNCKEAKKAININGTDVSPEVKHHLKTCRACAEIYQAESRIEKLFRGTAEIQAPENLKKAILESILIRSERKQSIPFFSRFVEVALGVSVLFLGFWLGLQTANGVKQNDIPDHEVYAMNVSASSEDSLNELYLAVLEDTSDVK